MMNARPTVARPTLCPDDRSATTRASIDAGTYRTER
jgi:hypothetical protein